MNLLVIKENKVRINHFIEWLIYIVLYTVIFILITNLFKSVYIDMQHTYIYSILIVLILSLLNSTIKPILVTLTMPLTGLTFGIFYPCINLFLLKVTDWILGRHFELKNLLIAFFVAVLLSIANFIMENLIIKPLVERVKKKWKE